MYKYIKGGVALFVVCVNSFVASADVTNFVAACDENGQVYVADWIAASNKFENFRWAASLRGNEGEGSYIRGVAIGDYNGDGYDDIAAARRVYSGRATIFILYNDGSNNFRNDGPFDFPVNTAGWMMDASSGDYNNDGIDDFTFNPDNASIFSWTSNGEGGFDFWSRGGLRGNGRGTDCADFNNDGILDIFRCSYGNGGWIQYLEGNGDGTFKAPVDYPHIGNDPYGMALGDFDNDGDNDRIANTGASGDTYFYENTGTVFFAAATNLVSLDVNNHGSFDAYDYDDDGNLDFVITDYNGRHLYFLRSNGDGTFTNAVLVGLMPTSTMAVSAPPLPPLPSRPTAVATPMIQTVPVNTSAALDASLSTTLNGVLVSNRWEFGDGDVTPWLSASVTETDHVYTVEGHYRPRLYILDSAGHGAMRTVDVFVEGAEPQALTNEVTYGESDAFNGMWPVDIPITNLVYDAEGISNYCWAVSNIVDIGFESGSAPGWSAMDGTWVVTNSYAFSGTNCYRQLNTVPTRTRNMLNDVIEGDFIFEVDFMMVGGTGEEVQLNICGSGWYNTYDIIIRGRGYNDVRIDRIVDNGTTVLYDNPLGFVLTNNVPVHAEIHRKGDEISVYINGRWVGTTCNSYWSTGRIGLSTYKCDVVFDNVKVHRIGCNENISATLHEGTYTLNIAASDGAVQTLHTNVNIVCSNDGTPPSADAGTDIVMDESMATNGVWLAMLDGTGSTDAQSETANLMYRWNPGLETFDGEDMDAGLWYTSSSVYQTNQIVIPDQGGWGACYAVTKHTVQRSAGTVFQARIRSTGNSMAGFFHATGFSYTQMPYAFYFNGGYMRIYEDGAQKRFVWFLNTAYYYDVRIILKPDQGAMYYMRQADVGAPWTLVYDSDHSTATDLRRGITLDSGTAFLDDFDPSVCGESPMMPFYAPGTRSVELTVTDPAGNSDTDTVQVILSGNNPPVADAGPNLVQGEAEAVVKTWTFDFDGSASTDDFGIYKYEWDWDYTGTFNPSGDTGVNQTHQWTEPGIYTVALRVTDHALQTGVTNITVTITGGTDPAAAHGGPYYFDEFTGNATNGYWNISLDAGASTDNESTNLYARWSLGDDPLDDPRLLDLKWVHDAGTIITNGMMRLGSDGAMHYAYTREVFDRVPGLRAEARVRTSVWNTEQGFGFKQDNASVGWNYWVYALALDNSSGQIAWWENGTWANTGITYSPNEWYDFRIELKEHSGAYYYYKPAASNDWVLLRETDGQTYTKMRRGFIKSGGATTFEADSYHEWAAGTNVEYKLYLHHLGTNDVELTVIDQAMNTDTVNTTITCMTNAHPVAAFYPSNLTLNEEQAVNGIWQVPFTAMLSTDDHGIMKYEWDVGYDPVSGFRTGGSTSPTMVHQFSAPGTYPVALRVTDHLLQQNIAVGQVVCNAGTAPVAVIPGSYTVEKGWAVEFDGTASVDDSAVVNYEWDFGDGTTGSGARPKHVYLAETNVLLRLRVFDGVGQMSDWVTATVAVVTSTLPTADAGSDYSGAAGGPPVYFNGKGSTDNANPTVIQGVTRYNWDIDLGVDSNNDGNPSNDVDYVLANPFHTYAASGVYTSRLVVVDGSGQADTNDAVVTIVDDLAPHVICVPWHGDINQYHKAISGEAVTLKAVVRDAGALTHQWLFGDGTSSAVAPVNNKYAVEIDHTYTGVQGQPFTATLIVWDAAGNEGRDTYRVKIAPSDDATRADIAIDRGLWWLHKDQNKASGRWASSYPGLYAASDSAALLSLQINAHRLLGNPMEDPYVETIRLGFMDIFNLLQTDVMALQNGNDPDTNGNGIGIRTSGTHAGYQTGMVMDAIAASRELLAVSPTGTSTNTKHRIFLDILTDMVDEYAWGQQDSGGMRGGWRYNMNGGADNSAAQWGAIGLLAAKDMFGINIPQFVIDENKIWLNASRNANGVNYGYDGPNAASGWGWNSVTPSAMVQMCLDGIETTDPIWTATEDQMRKVWPIESMSSKLYYGNYSFVKAMRSAKPSPVDQMHLDGFEWYADPVEGIRVKITGQQDGDGSWYAYARQNNDFPLYKTMSTAWAIAMLTPSLFSVPPVAVVDAPPYWPYDKDLVLDASKSYHPDGSRSITRYSWDLNGDGIYTVITNQPYAVINVPDQGKGDITVTVKLRVTDDNDPAVSSETFVQIRFSSGPFQPFADPGGPYSGYAEVPFSVDGSASWDLDNDNIVQYMWDFTNDGTNDLVTTTPTGQWIYDEVGQHTAYLRVVDDGDPAMSTSLWEYVAVTIEEPPQYPLPEGLDSTNRVWITGGDGVWTGQIVRTHDTIDAGGTPAITNLQSVWFESTFDGPGTITFWWKTSSEEYFDWLYFYVDDTLHGGVSGDTAWKFVSYTIDDDESHTLRWEYRKDKTLSANRDEAYVDQVVWTPSGELTGFAAFLEQYGLTGADMSTLGTDDHIAYGFEYTFGFSPVVSNDVSLLGFSYDGGVRFVDTPMQDPSTIPYIDFKVKATTNLLSGVWPFDLTPTNHTSVPGGREWWIIPDGHSTMFFKLWAGEK